MFLPQKGEFKDKGLGTVEEVCFAVLGRARCVLPHVIRPFANPPHSGLRPTLPGAPRSPCSQAPTEPLDPLGRMDEEEDPEGTPGPNSAGAPRARVPRLAVRHITRAHHPPAPLRHLSPAHSLVLAVRVPMIYSCHRRSHRRLSPPYHHHATNAIVTTATTVTTVTASATTVTTAIFPTAPLLLPLRSPAA